jgi:mannose/fructose/N-acetylgalactosamine-specific phosphotransferase system component IID
MFCQYKNIFGEPGKGIHKYRIFNLAAVDVIATIVMAFIIYLLYPKYKFFHILFILFLLGIILHHIFCVRTTIDKLLFPK